MENIIPFLTQHWILIALLIVTVIAIIFFELYTQSTGPQRIKPQMAVHYINREDGIVIDARDLEIFKKGHVVNSQNIPPSDLEKNIKRLVKYKKTPIILVCSSPQDASRIFDQLNKNGFEQVKILENGIKAWQEAGLPLEQTSKKKN